MKSQLIEILGAKKAKKNDILLKIQDFYFDIIQHFSHANYLQTRVNRRNREDSEQFYLLANTIYKNFEKNIFPLISLEEIASFDKNSTESFRSTFNKSDIHSIINSLKNKDDQSFEWDIEVIIHGETFSSSQIGFLMWTVSNTLESLGGVDVQLIDWGNGSKRFNLKAFFNDPQVKEEAKQILVKARYAAETSFLDKPIEEVSKIKAEKEKLIKEADNILSKGQVQELHEVEMDLKRLEIEARKAEIMNSKMEAELKKLQIIKGYSELIKEGIITNDSDLQIFINGVPYIQRIAGKLIVGERIEIIEANEVRNDSTKDDQDK